MGSVGSCGPSHSPLSHPGQDLHLHLHPLNVGGPMTDGAHEALATVTQAEPSTMLVHWAFCLLTALGTGGLMWISLNQPVAKSHGAEPGSPVDSNAWEPILDVQPPIHWLQVRREKITHGCPVQGVHPQNHKLVTNDYFKLLRVEATCYIGKINWHWLLSVKKLLAL